MTSYLQSKGEQKYKVYTSFESADCVLFKYVICLAVVVTSKKLERFKVHFLEVDDVSKNVDFWSKFFLAHLGFEISIVDLVKMRNKI